MFIFSFLLFCSSSTPTVFHNDYGTEYGEKAVVAYAESNHGADGSLFLDPYFKPDIENIQNKRILDAGCGAAPWSIYAANQGGEVYAIDLQEGMIQAANKAVEAAQLSHRVKVVQGDVAKLPYVEKFFDKAISICVGCNLPPEAFDNHFSELQRTLKNEGIAVIAAPTSLDVIFSDGSKSDVEIRSIIQETLDRLPDSPPPELISETLSQLQEVLSATFYIKNNRLILVENEKDLQEGEKIWRKLSKPVVPNRYYSKNYYESIFKKYKFEIQKIDMPHFKNEDDR
jgi:ubiquinone/menaquinone biosynthesis C-methylase UbiE